MPSVYDCPGQSLDMSCLTCVWCRSMVLISIRNETQHIQGCHVLCSFFFVVCRLYSLGGGRWVYRGILLVNRAIPKAINWAVTAIDQVILFVQIEEWMQPDTYIFRRASVHKHTTRKQTHTHTHTGIHLRNNRGSNN
jgi:hypothetical protein